MKGKKNKKVRGKGKRNRSKEDEETARVERGSDRKAS